MRAFVLLALPTLAAAFGTKPIASQPTLPTACKLDYCHCACTLTFEFPESICLPQAPFEAAGIAYANAGLGTNYTTAEEACSNSFPDEIPCPFIGEGFVRDILYTVSALTEADIVRCSVRGD